MPPGHVIVGERRSVAIHWKASGRGPRPVDFASLMSGARNYPAWIDASVRASRRRTEVTYNELDWLEGVTYVRRS